jgi:hypothetical protein
MSDTMNEFTSPDMVDTNDAGFLNSNGIVAKLVFLIMVVIGFVVVFYISLMIMGWFNSSSSNPMLIDGQINGSTYTMVPQNPANSASKSIMRSNNQASGIEFTWSVWLNYQGSPSEKKYNPVFIKGDNTRTNDYGSVNHGPGVYFGKNGDNPNTLHILMDTVTHSATQVEIIVIPNLPTGTYFHLGVRCQNTFIDVYINGTLIKRQNLGNAPKQNYYNVHVCPHGGFSGTLSNLQYFDRALSVVELNSIVQGGPNMRTIAGTPFSYDSVNVMSTSWYNNFLL